jgi:GNAT superfamily N-acetyltransferase
VDLSDAPAFVDDEEIAIREAVPGDLPTLAAFTADTWENGDYIADAFPRWMEADDPDSETIVAVDLTADPLSADEVEGVDSADVGELPDDRPVGICQAVGLSDHEGWMQAMRVDPAYRGRGLSVAMNDAGFYWLYQTGRRVARNMVFSWNTGGLGTSRACGFDPGTEFRWVRPEPDASAPEVAGDASVVDGGEPRSSSSRMGSDDADAAWSFWSSSDARDDLRGLALDTGESWALAELTRERLRNAAQDNRLQVVSGREGGIGGFSYRTRTSEQEDDGESFTRAEYGVAAWTDPDACEALLAAISRDAAAAGADRTRVLVPEDVRWVSDTAAAGVDIGDEPDFVMAADLTRRPWER